MQPHAVLVNTARGPVVDEEALADALERGTIFGAGIDVYEREPHVHPKLLAAPHAVLPPAHRQRPTERRGARMAQVACEGVLAVLAGEDPRNLVPPDARLRRTPTRPGAAERGAQVGGGRGI